MGNADFRVGGRIFATLAAVKQGYGNLMLTPERQAEYVSERPDIFRPVAGGWGRNGATHVVLSLVEEDLLAGALFAAWKVRIEKNQKVSRPARLPSAAKRVPARPRRKDGQKPGTS